MSGIGPRSVVVVSGGLAQPSSTRLLADRITAATERHLREAGVLLVLVAVAKVNAVRRTAS